MKKLIHTVFGVAILATIAATAQNSPTTPQGQRQGFNRQEQGQRGPAQQRQYFSPEEYRERQQKFLTEKSGLTEDECAKFFPIYFELQQKKNEINANSRQTIANRRNSGPLTDEDCTKLIDNLADANIKIAQLEKEYLEKFKKVVPASKLLRIQIAEKQFGSEMLKEMQRPMPATGGINGGTGRGFNFPWQRNNIDGSQPIHRTMPSGTGTGSAGSR